MVNAFIVIETSTKYIPIFPRTKSFVWEFTAQDQVQLLSCFLSDSSTKRMSCWFDGKLVTLGVISVERGLPCTQKCIYVTT